MTNPVNTDALREVARERSSVLNMDEVAIIDAAADEVDRLRAAVENAPHDIDCACGTMMNVEEFFPCSCWKADAL